MKEEKVILVDREDNSVGTLPKMEAHEKGVLHRAFSVFILNQKGELMLQQRALHKYHSPALWTNTCCSHQREGEENLQAGTLRLEEEMGFSVPLEELFSFIYKAPFDNGLTEHELDHVMLGYYEGIPEINSDEVNAWKWMSLNEIASDLTVNPESYTVWFKIIFERFFNHVKSTK